MRKFRIKAINSLLDEIKAKGYLTYNDALRYIMVNEVVSRMTAERYLQDLIFIGRITEKQDKLTIASLK
jgi:hypothetical protein